MSSCSLSRFWRGSLGGLFVVSILGAGCDGQLAKPTRGDDPPQVRIQGSQVSDLFQTEGRFLVSSRLDTPELATRVGFMLDLEEDIDAHALQLEARGFDKEGHAGPWFPAQINWSEDLLRVAHADLEMQAQGIQIRLPASESKHYSAITYSGIVPMPETDSTALVSASRESSTKRSALDAELAANGVNSRSDWGARATRCSGQDLNKVKMAIHHTVTPTTSNGSYEARIRQIQSYHMDALGWCDIGYHFVVSANGQVWEAREAQYQGAHVANHNQGNIGVSFVGCFNASGCDDMTPNIPPEDMLRGAGALIGSLSQHYDIAVDSETVKGHLDFDGAQTSCPGSYLYDRLDDLRDMAVSGNNPNPPSEEPSDLDPVTTPEPDATKPFGVVQGVIWDASLTAGPADNGALRIPGASIRAGSGESVVARASDAYWILHLEEGVHVISVDAPGYESATRTISVGADTSTWSSVGINPEEEESEAQVPVDGPVDEPVNEPNDEPAVDEPDPSEESTTAQDEPAPVQEDNGAKLSIYVYDAYYGREFGLDEALVFVNGSFQGQSDLLGEIITTVDSGEVHLSIRREGYFSVEQSYLLDAGVHYLLEVGLVYDDFVEVKPEDLDGPIQDPIVLAGSADKPEAPELASLGQGMNCAAGQSADYSVFALMAGAFFLIRRQRR